MFNILSRKRCNKCSEVKSLGDFYKNKANKDGLDSICINCNKEKYQAWRLANPEKHAARNVKWARNNPEKIQEHDRQYKTNNPDKVHARQTRWIKAHPEKSLESSRTRTARKKGSGGKITSQEWQALKEFYNFTCLCCGKQEPEIKLTLDHVVPLKLGGLHVIENAQCLCLSCNCSKGAKTKDYRKGEYAKLL